MSANKLRCRRRVLAEQPGLITGADPCVLLVGAGHPSGDPMPFCCSTFGVTIERQPGPVRGGEQADNNGYQVPVAHRKPTMTSRITRPTDHRPTPGRRRGAPRVATLDRSCGRKRPSPRRRRSTDDKWRPKPPAAPPAHPESPAKLRLSDCEWNRHTEYSHYESCQRSQGFRGHPW